jgi:uncharacterized membrane protein YraQ (UPF0718 family)
MLKYLFAAMLVLLLAGCIGDQRNSQAPSPPVINITPAQPAQSDVSKADLEKLHSETQAMATTAQQSMTGLGANIASLQARTTGIEGDVSAVKTQITATMQNIANVFTELKATLTANTTAVAQIKADMKAEFDAKLTAQAQINATAVAALKSEITSLTQNMSAGRDVNSTQFTKEMQQTLTAAYQAQVRMMYYAFGTLIAICHIWAGLIIAILHGSVKHERKQRDLAMTRDARTIKEVASGQQSSG